MGVKEPLPERCALSRVPWCLELTSDWLIFHPRSLPVCVLRVKEVRHFSWEKEKKVTSSFGDIMQRSIVILNGLLTKSALIKRVLWETMRNIAYKADWEIQDLNVAPCANVVCSGDALFRKHRHTNTHVQTRHRAALWMLPSVFCSFWQLMPHFCWNYRGLRFE